MSGPLSSPRPIFGVKIGVASWVRPACGRTGPPAPPNPTGNPNFNPKNRPEVNKSGPELPEFCLRTKKLRKNCKKIAAILINGVSINNFVDEWAVDQ
jgi:hypothetical protein